MRQRVVRIELANFFKFLQRAVCPIHSVVRHRQIQMGARISGLDQARAQQRVDCFLVVALF